MNRDVMLLHGLWMPGVVMSRLASRLAERGFRTHLFDYPGRRRSLEDHADGLAHFARTAAAGAPVHFVGHSLGGLVVLACLAMPNPPAVATVVLLGTPARGCMAGRRLARAAGGRWLLGASVPLWNDGPLFAGGGDGNRQSRLSEWNRSAPLGVVAGSRPLGIGRMLGRLPGTNDGVVRLEETEVSGMADRIVLPVAHSELIFSARVAMQTANFLADGKFSHEG